MESNGLSNEERKILSGRMVDFQVSLLEKELLLELRTLSHGKFIIQMLDGVPFRYQIEISKFFDGDTDFSIMKTAAKGGESNGRQK